MTTIAGKQTEVGDELWHNALGLWAQVVAPGIVLINGVNDQKVKYAFTDGGKINGKRQLSWHFPLILDLPMRDVSKYQRILDALVKEI